MMRTSRLPQQQDAAAIRRHRHGEEEARVAASFSASDAQKLL